jgi:hypothetical protein
MIPARLVMVVRAALVAAAMASAALVIDYENPGDPAFCGVESACLKLRRSTVGQEIAERLYPMTLPQLGLLAITVLIVFSFLLTERTRLSAFVGAATFGGLAALGLIVAQASINTFCLYCMIVDTSTLVAAGASLALLRAVKNEADLERDLSASMRWPVTLRWALAVAVGVVAPFVWARYPAVPPLPAPIAALQKPGKLTVVSFTDFQCPYCRLTHPILTELRKRPEVDFHRVMAPLEFHPGAEPAALGYLCMPEDKRDELADLLYAADEVHLTTPGVLEMARTLGADGDAFSACVSSKATADQLAADKKLFHDAGGSGLPTTFVGRNVVVGYNAERYARVIARTDAGPLELPLWGLFGLVGVTIAWVVVATSRVLASDRKTHEPARASADAGAVGEATDAREPDSPKA